MLEDLLYDLRRGDDDGGLLAHFQAEERAVGGGELVKVFVEAVGEVREVAEDGPSDGPRRGVAPVPATEDEGDDDEGD